MKRKGIALVLVLTMMSVLMLLMSAFVTANRQNFNLMGVNARQREAQFAAESGLHFAWFQLANNQAWGKEPFNSGKEISPDEPGGAGLRVWQVDGKCSITGHLVDEKGTGREAEFTIVIRNNLAMPGENKILGKDVPPDACLLTVTGTSGTFESVNDVLLTGAPIYTASLTANNAIIMDTPDVLLTSEDPMRNWVRSNGDITLPDFVNGGDTLKVETKDNGPKGVIWAKKDIFSGSEKLDKADEVAKADQKSDGILSPNSPLKLDIYGLKKSDLKMGGEAVTADQEVSLDSGRYITSGARALINGVWTGFPVLRHISESGEKTLYYNKFLQGSNLTFEQEDGWTIKECSNIVKLGKGPGPDGCAVTYQIDQAHYKAANPGKTIQVKGQGGGPGDLNIECAVLTATDQYEPKLTLAPDGSTESAAINAQGSIRIQGQLKGGGGLLAGNDIWLMANINDSGGSEVAVEAQAGDAVVLYGQNINVAGGGADKVSFKGLVYAEKDVNFLGDVKLTTNWDWQHPHAFTEPKWGETTTTNKLNNLYLEGAVVAHTGNIHIDKTKHIEARYNDKFLKAVTKSIATSEKENEFICRKLEMLWTHEN